MQFQGQYSQELPIIRTFGPDSYYIPNFISVLGMNHAQIFSELLRDIEWVDRNSTSISYRGRPINRTKGFYTANCPADSVTGIPSQIFKYVYPGFTHRILLQHRCFSDLPILNELVERITNGLTCNGEAVIINHGIATQYVMATDGIGAHQDKLKSLVPGCPILCLSFGDTREMVLTDLDGELKHTLIMEPGSLFVLGHQTNLVMKHAIVPIAGEKITQRPVGNVASTRISIVLRNIAESLNESQVIEAVIDSIGNSLKKDGDGLPSLANVSKEVARLRHNLKQMKKQSANDEDENFDSLSHLNDVDCAAVTMEDICALDELFEQERRRKTRRIDTEQQNE